MKNKESKQIQTVNGICNPYSFCVLIIDRNEPMQGWVVQSWKSFYLFYQFEKNGIQLVIVSIAY